MKSILSYASPAIVFILLACTGANASAQAAWHMDARSATGPIALLPLPDAGNNRRIAFIAFEFAHSCDPIFSFAEINGSGFGVPVSQSILKDSKIGIILNGTFHTWHAAITKYNNGYEAGFGVTNELFLQLLVNLDSLAYVTPMGERIPLPIAGFREAVQAAIDLCRRHVK